jgi:hypothetical protein
VVGDASFFEVVVAGSENPREAAFEETRSDLKEGLESCRAVVRNYRELLTDEPPADVPQPPVDGGRAA